MKFSPEFEQLSIAPLDPTNYCYKCRELIRPGMLVCFKEIPHVFRYGKQRKKAKGETVHVHKIHAACAVS